MNESKNALSQFIFITTDEISPSKVIVLGLSGKICLPFVQGMSPHIDEEPVMAQNGNRIGVIHRV